MTHFQERCHFGRLCYRLCRPLDWSIDWNERVLDTLAQVRHIYVSSTTRRGLTSRHSCGRSLGMFPWNMPSTPRDLHYFFVFSCVFPFFAFSSFPFSSCVFSFFVFSGIFSCVFTLCFQHPTPFMNVILHPATEQYAWCSPQYFLLGECGIQASRQFPLFPPFKGQWWVVLPWPGIFCVISFAGLVVGCSLLSLVCDRVWARILRSCLLWMVCIESNKKLTPSLILWGWVWDDEQTMTLCIIENCPHNAFVAIFNSVQLGGRLCGRTIHWHGPYKEGVQQSRSFATTLCARCGAPNQWLTKKLNYALPGHSSPDL